MQRWVIFGGSGSDKTTLAIRWAERLGLPAVHLDALYRQHGGRHLRARVDFRDYATKS
jgi:adenylate kinase family enzyme